MNLDDIRAKVTKAQRVLRQSQKPDGSWNWPKCDWVSFNRPLQEPCPECGGIQVETGRGKVRCLKHEGEPPRRFAARERTNGTAKPARNGRAKKPVRRAAAKKA